MWRRRPCFCGNVGRYVSAPEIFAILRRSSARKGNEIQLTDGLNVPCRTQGVWALPFEGRRWRRISKNWWLSGMRRLYSRAGATAKGQWGPRLDEVKIASRVYPSMVGWILGSPSARPWILEGEKGLPAIAQNSAD